MDISPWLLLAKSRADSWTEAAFEATLSRIRAARADLLVRWDSGVPERWAWVSAGAGPRSLKGVALLSADVPLAIVFSSCAADVRGLLDGAGAVVLEVPDYDTPEHSVDPAVASSVFRNWLPLTTAQIEKQTTVDISRMSIHDLFWLTVA